MPPPSHRAPDVQRMAEEIARALHAGPLFFMDLVRAHREAPYRTLLLAWGEVRDRYRLSRDDDGRYFLTEGRGERRA
jgi:hypothetical protein